MAIKAIVFYREVYTDRATIEIFTGNGLTRCWPEVIFHTLYSTP